MLDRAALPLMVNQLIEILAEKSTFSHTGLLRPCFICFSATVQSVVCTAEMDDRKTLLLMSLGKPCLNIPNFRFASLPVFPANPQNKIVQMFSSEGNPSLTQCRTE